MKVDHVLTALLLTLLPLASCFQDVNATEEKAALRKLVASLPSCMVRPQQLLPLSLPPEIYNFPGRRLKAISPGGLDPVCCHSCTQRLPPGDDEVRLSATKQSSRGL